MNRIKMTLSALVLTGLTVIAPMAAHAAATTGIVNSTLNSSVTGTGLSGTSAETIIITLIQTILGLLAIIVLVLIVYAGVLWMTAGGSEEKVQKAQGIIKNAVIGLLIIMASWGIVTYISTVLGAATGTGVTS